MLISNESIVFQLIVDDLVTRILNRCVQYDLAGANEHTKNHSINEKQIKIEIGFPISWNSLSFISWTPSLTSLQVFNEPHIKLRYKTKESESNPGLADYESTILIWNHVITSSLITLKFLFLKIRKNTIRITYKCLFFHMITVSS